MTRLVRIGTGTWVDPDTVRQIATYSVSPAKTDWRGKETSPAYRPSVVVTTDQQTFTFRFDDIDAAEKGAGAMANAINGGTDEPDDPVREDVPVDETEKVVVLRGVVK